MTEHSGGADVERPEGALVGGDPTDSLNGEPVKRRRRGSRGGQAKKSARQGASNTDSIANPDLPDPPNEGRRWIETRTPQIGDSRPAPTRPSEPTNDGEKQSATQRRSRGRRGGAGRNGNDRAADVETSIAKVVAARPAPRDGGQPKGGQPKKQRQRPVQAIVEQSIHLDEKMLAQRRGRERNGRPIGRYLMAVHVGHGRTQIAVLEGRSLTEHYVSKPLDDVSEIHGNVYLGRVQNVLPGMEAAFVDIATPKNAVLYAGDVSIESDDDDDGPRGPRRPKPRIEEMLKAKQMIICQATKNPIGAKGARLTQEVSLPGRFVVLIPNSKTYGISKRLPDNERKRLRNILDKVKPEQHGVIVRTAAENVIEEELRADVLRLLRQWEQIESLAARSKAPTLLYREPDMAVRVIREEFNNEYRNVIIDDLALFEEVRDYVAAISPALADRVEYYDPAVEGLPLYERHHIHEQLHKALDRKVWLPSGGSLIIEHTEALTVIDVNTGKNVGSTNLEDTVLHNNLEAAAEIARQLRLRDVGGIIVIDFIDMEIRDNRTKVVTSFRDALARDKTRSQVFDISDLGLVEMTRKRIGEGLLTSYGDTCEHCAGRGLIIDQQLLS